jgi:adenylate cyclase
MATKPNKLSRFWQELKRRRVIHVITVYASSAFVIIELINNLAEPFNLPSNFLIIAVIVLAVGFPLAIVLSWLYDLTSEGIEKTKPLEELKEGEKTTVPNAWRIATIVSFVVILGLAVLNIMGRDKKIRAGDIQSLVILPFENFTGDDQFDNMIYSMHSLLIGDIGRIVGLRITGTTSARKYKDTDMSAKDIASELNVDAVLESTIMSLGDSVHMQFRLISTSGEEDQIWIGDYNEDKRQILNLYNRITERIAREVKVQLTPEAKRILAKSRTVDREAFDDYLKSGYLRDDWSKESLYKALEYLNSAIQKDPGWAPLYTERAGVWLTISQFSYEAPEFTGPKISANLNKALELDPDLAGLHGQIALNAYLREWNWEKSEKEFLKSIAINPNAAGTRVLYGHLLCILQRHSEALSQGQLAIELDPFNDGVQIWYAAILDGVGECETALNIGEKLLATNPDHVMAHSLIESAAYHCGDYNRMFEATKHLLDLDFEKDTINKILMIYDEQGFVAAYEEIANQMEVMTQNGYISPAIMAVQYIYANRPDRAMDWLEKGEKPDQQMPYIASGWFPFDTLYENPRFIAILDKMNLPHPKK